MKLFILSEENIAKLREISKDAGDAIMDVYETNFDVKTKSDKSPITQADIIANRIICESLVNILPNIPILSEESSEIPLHERSRWKYYWLVDPLDGTKEFINKNGEFTTNIALIKNNRPIFGIIYAPEKKKMYWGSKEYGQSVKADNNKSSQEKIEAVANSINPIRIATSRSHQSNKIKSILIKCF